MPKYLIDVNLPYYFSLWNTDEYIHQRDVDARASDTDIWQYARQHNLTILTKDRDYSDRILLLNPPPRIVHLRIGNMKMRELHIFLAPVWSHVLEMSESHKLVYVFKDSIEGID